MGVPREEFIHGTLEGSEPPLDAGLSDFLGPLADHQIYLLIVNVTASGFLYYRKIRLDYANAAAFSIIFTILSG